MDGRQLRGALALLALLTAGCSTTAVEISSSATTEPTSAPSTTAPSTTGPSTTEPSTTTGATTTGCPPHAAVETAVWVDLGDGPSLEVTPSTQLRRCGGMWTTAPDPPPGWESLIALVPDASSPGMQAQYACHLRWASGKAVWHLEPWRPVVEPEEMFASLCNPGGPDPDLSG